MKRERTRRIVDWRNVKRASGYYWVRISNGQSNHWVIGKWYESLQFFDTMANIQEIGRRDKIIEVDENRLKRE
jgi:hypothetical protein